MRARWGNDPSLMFTMDAEFRNEWHKVQIPANPDDLRKSLIDAGLKPSSTARQAVTSKPDKKKKKAPRRGGKQTNVHMSGILQDYSHLRK
jgi:transcription initiation factor TFIIE subunit beta